MKGPNNEMNFRKAAPEDLRTVTDIVQRTVAEVYPKYYPKEAVDFFSQIHCRENIAGDIEEGRVGVLEAGGAIVGTGSRDGQHITRVYVLPEHQGNGYGGYILGELEKEISGKYSRIVLDASLPACRFYESKGYRTVRHEEAKCEGNVVLVYDVMEKLLVL